MYSSAHRVLPVRLHGHRHQWSTEQDVGGRPSSHRGEFFSNAVVVGYDVVNQEAMVFAD